MIWCPPMHKKIYDVFVLSMHIRMFRNWFRFTQGRGKRYYEKKLTFRIVTAKYNWYMMYVRSIDQLYEKNVELHYQKQITHDTLSSHLLATLLFQRAHQKNDEWTPCQKIASQIYWRWDMTKWDSDIHIFTRVNKFLRHAHSHSNTDYNVLGLITVRLRVARQRADCLGSTRDYHHPHLHGLLAAPRAWQVAPEGFSTRQFLR